jgi:hypothetical protein
MKHVNARQLLAAYERDHGIYFPEAKAFLQPEWGDNYQIAMDAQPELVTTPSSGIPAFLTTIIDPQILRIRQANNNAAMIFDEVKKGTWVTESSIFPVVERGGNVTSYGDFENGGATTANSNFETRQPYLFQTVCIWGELQLERAGLAKISWAAELQGAAADVLGKYENLIYFKGVAGLANYGIQTDPNLQPAIAPAPKANGGFSWLSNGITPNGTPNEIFVDIQTAVNQLINQSSGNIDTKSEMVLALSPSREGAITATNAFDVNVMDLLKKNYPNLRIVNAIQYGAITPQNPQGVATGEMMQIIALRPGNQDTGWLAFNEKLRAHRVVAEMSSFKQKMTSGAYGAILRQLFAISTMIGI